MFLLSNDYWELRNTPDKGRGIFTKKDIPPGTIIGDYLGVLMQTKNFDESKYGLYDMYYNDDSCIYPDPKTVGIHLINHSCSSNCDMYPYKGHSIYFAIRQIFAGEELTVQYLLNPPEKSHPCSHVCYCNSPVCHGTMHTTIATYKQADAFTEKVDGNYNGKLPVAYGEQVPVLPEYPKNIPDDPTYDMYGSLEKQPLEMTDNRLPSKEAIRAKIRDSGKILNFKNLNLCVFGVTNELIVGTEDPSKILLSDMK